MRSRLRKPWMLLSAVSLLGVTACGGAEAGNADAANVVRLATSTLAASLDPVADLSASYLRAVGAAEALTRIRPDGTVAPELAERLEATAPTVWAATLRDGATFWKGGRVDAAAVVASLERSRENVLATGLLKDVTIAASGPRTVTFTTPRPAYYLPYALSHYQLVIHDAAAYSAGSQLGDASLTGPYRVTAFETDRRMVLEANKAWWGGQPGLHRVEVSKVGDGQARAQLALSGQADIVQDLPYERVKEVDAAAQTTAVTRPAATTAAVYLNPRSASAPALADQRVRQALAWAVDREEVARLATSGLAVPTPSWLASSPAFPDATEHGFTRHDAALAGRLLDQAGWVAGADGKRTRAGKRLTFRLLTFGQEARTGEVLQAQWARLGVDAQVRNVDNALIKKALGTGDWDAVTQAWTTLGDPLSLMSAQLGPGGAANHGKYTDPRVGALLTRAATAPGQEDRTAALYALNRLSTEIVPLVPVHPRVAATAVHTSVAGFVAHPLQYENIIQPTMTRG